MREPLIRDPVELAKRLEASPEVTRYDHGEHKEAWVLAHALWDLEGEFRTFLDRDLPQLIEADGPEATYDSLAQIREGLRHVFYHLLDAEFLSFGPLAQERGKRD
jgi:hypothetical protein